MKRFLLPAALLASAGLARAESPREAVVRALERPSESSRLRALASLRPSILETVLEEDDSVAAAALRTFAAALGRARPEQGEMLQKYLAAVDRERVARISRSAMTKDGIRALLDLLLLDPSRFLSDASFRGRVVGILSNAWEAAGSPALREIVLSEIGSSGALSFEIFEKLQRKWGAVSRSSATRHIRFQPGEWRFSSDVFGKIDASIYSLPSAFFEPAAAERFLSAVRASDPARRIVVFSDAPLFSQLAPEAARLRVRVLDTFGWGFTPWTRDTFSLLRGAGGRILALERPPGPLQGGRERDDDMARELIKDLPESIDREWHEPVWSKSSIPFHNGQVLLTESEAWISLHTLEPRILEMLGLRRVPVQSFARAKGVSRYVAAARRAAAELSALYGRPVRFIHPLPASEDARAQSDLMTAIGGGAGFDLDSIVTLVSGNGSTTAFVGDVGAGRDLLRGAADNDLDAFRNGFGLSGSASSLRSALVAYNETARPANLGRFLDLSADHLRREGLEVKRLPIFLVPVEALADSTGLPAGASFSINWNNVVLESGDSSCRAEGFANLLAAGDEIARRSFEAAGCRLVLYPPLVSSIIRNGGYRCASNHLRTEIKSVP